MVTPMSARIARWPEGEPLTTFGSLAEFLNRSEDVAGNISITHGAKPIQLRWLDKNASTTLVLFTAAVHWNVKTVPVFSGHRTTTDVDANVLMISDPALEIDTDLTLGWYAGSAEHPTLQQDLTDIITSLSRDSRIVLFGGSGAGYPALEQSLRLPDCTALLVNPLTHVNLVERDIVRKYFKYAWNTTRPDDPYAAPFNNSVIDDYSEPVQAQVICIQNIRDDYHIDHYWQPFLDKLHPSNRVHTRYPNVGPGHATPDKQSMTRLFDTAVAHADWEELVAAIEALEITGPNQSARAGK